MKQLFFVIRMSDDDGGGLKPIMMSGWGDIGKMLIDELTDVDWRKKFYEIRMSEDAGGVEAE